MFPLRDHNPSNGTPVVTYVLIAANVAVFLISLQFFANERLLMAFFDDWALIPAAVSRGEALPGLLTSMFLHGGWLHLLGNMLFLWIFGDNLEEEMGHAGFLGFYLATGLLAAIVHVAAAPASPVPTVGASGAIAGVMGGYLLLFPKARVDVLFIFGFFFRVIPVPAFLMLGVWFAIQVLNGSVADGMSGGVAYWAHAGGFVAGLALSLPVWLKRGAAAFWARTHGTPPHPETRVSRSSVPIVRRRR